MYVTYQYLRNYVFFIKIYKQIINTFVCFFFYKENDRGLISGFVQIINFWLSNLIFKQFLNFVYIPFSNFQ